MENLYLDFRKNLHTSCPNLAQLGWVDFVITDYIIKKLGETNVGVTSAEKNLLSIIRI